METSCITTLVVEDNDKNVCGVIHLHDLLRAGVV
jgi:high-affinity K+ transport system ATPase subunit B